MKNKMTDNEDYIAYIARVTGIPTGGIVEESWFTPIDELTPEIYRTDTGAEYSVFEDDEEEGAVRIEIDPRFLWTKDDVWELMYNLLQAVGEIDEDGNLHGDLKPKPLFIISSEDSISDEEAEHIGDRAASALRQANIDAVPLILAEGITAHFDQPLN